MIVNHQFLRELMTSTEGLTEANGPIFGLGYSGMARNMSLTSAKWVWRRPPVALRSSPGNLGVVLCCPLSPASPISLSCPGQGVETPNFCFS